MRIILLGPPGSGKGTQGDLIQKHYGFPKISSGDLLRQAVQDRSVLGKKAEAIMKRGELVDDNTVLQMIAERISRDDCQKGYVLDGFPRNIRQAQKLEELENRRAEVVLDIRLKKEALVQRLSSRRICSACGNIYNLKIKSPAKVNVCNKCGAKLVQRNDDHPKVVKERLRVYHQKNEPLVQYYKNKGLYHRINGEQGIKQVFQDIQLVLEGEFEQTEKTGAVP